jgi:catechol-2,3-dioxygenase
MQTEKTTRHVIDPGTRIGYVHLKVANLERSLGFYRDILGFEITQWYGKIPCSFRPAATTTLS